MYRTVFWTVGEGESGMIWENGIETCIISYIKTNCQSRFNAWYWMLGAGALGWPRGGGFRMGNTCIPVVGSCWCMGKPIQYCQVIGLQLNKFIIFKKRKKMKVWQKLLLPLFFKGNIGELIEKENWVKTSVYLI